MSQLAPASRGLGRRVGPFASAVALSSGANVTRGRHLVTPMRAQVLRGLPAVADERSCAREASSRRRGRCSASALVGTERLCRGVSPLPDLARGKGRPEASPQNGRRPTRGASSQVTQRIVRTSEADARGRGNGTHSIQARERSCSRTSYAAGARRLAQPSLRQ